MDAIRNTSESAGIPTLTQGTPTSPDLLKILIRWKWLPILGSLIGATVGYLYFGQLAPLYKATAQVQVVAPPKEIPISTFDSRMDTRSRGDELVVVKSSSVLMNAIEVGHLTQHRQLLGKSAPEIVAMLKDPRSKMLDVRLGSKDLNSDIIDISVTTDNADLSGEIVQAIVSGYENHVNEKVNAFSKDAQLALTKFSDRYETAKKEAKKELDKLRLNPDLIWRDGKPHDPASEKIAKCMESISEIDVRIKNIEAVMNQVDRGREANRPMEELLRMVLNSTNDTGFRQSFDGMDMNREMDIARNLKAQVEQFESDRVIPLLDILEQLQGQSLGDSHPSVITARNRLDKYEHELAR